MTAHAGSHRRGSALLPPICYALRSRSPRCGASSEPGSDRPQNLEDFPDASRKMPQYEDGMVAVFHGDAEKREVVRFMIQTMNDEQPAVGPQQPGNALRLCWPTKQVEALFECSCFAAGHRPRPASTQARARAANMREKALFRSSKPFMRLSGAWTEQAVSDGSTNP